MDQTALTIELLKGAAELAKAARIAGGEGDSDRVTKAVQRLIDALRQIYFAPQGVLSLINKIIEGGYPTENQIRLVLPEFNEGEHWVNRARHDLDDKFLRRIADLTLRGERVLGEISYGKGGVRTKVKRLLNESLTFGEPISVDEAKSLKEEILLLNEAIEEAEERLVAAIR